MKTINISLAADPHTHTNKHAHALPYSDHEVAWLLVHQS